MSNTATGYVFDENGYYKNTCLVQKIDENYLIPKDTTLTAPTVKDGYFSRYVDNAWTLEKIPTSCKEAIKLNYSCTANSPDAHQRALKAIIEKLVNAESDVYKTVIDSDMNMTIEAIPEKTLDEVKSEKLTELDSIAGQFDQYKCDSMYITSSLGYRFNADIRSQTNMQGLIDVLTDDTVTQYKDYDNEFRTLTKNNLTLIKNEAIANGQELYSQKWNYQTKINACTTIDEVNAITIEFVMKDFSK